jgi:hypothetical protein
VKNARSLIKFSKDHLQHDTHYPVGVGGVKQKIITTRTNLILKLYTFVPIKNSGRLFLERKNLCKRFIVLFEISVEKWSVCYE